MLISSHCNWNQYWCINSSLFQGFGVQNFWNAGHIRPRPHGRANPSGKTGRDTAGTKEGSGHGYAVEVGPLCSKWAEVQFNVGVTGRFTIECRKLGFCITAVCDWWKAGAIFLTKTNLDLLARVFPSVVPYTCVSFEIWLVHRAVCICCDWLN